MAKSDKGSSDDQGGNPLVEGASSDLQAVTDGASTIHQRVEGVESLLARLIGFMAWLFPGHQVPGTPEENNPAAAGPNGSGVPPSAIGPAPATPGAAQPAPADAVGQNALGSTAPQV